MAKLQIGKKNNCFRIESQIFFKAESGLEIRKFLIEDEKRKLDKLLNEYNSRCFLSSRSIILKFTIQLNSEYTNGSILFDNILNRLSIGTIPLILEETVRVDYATDFQTGRKEYNFFKIYGSMPFFLPHRWKIKTDYGKIFEYLLYQVIYDLEWHNSQNRKISFTKQYSDFELIELCFKNPVECNNDLLLKTKMNLRVEAHQPFRKMILDKLNSSINGFTEICKCNNINTSLCSEANEFKIEFACKEYDNCRRNLPYSKNICDRAFNVFLIESVNQLKSNPPSKSTLMNKMIYYSSLYEIFEEFYLDDNLK